MKTCDWCPGEHLANSRIADQHGAVDLCITHANEALTDIPTAKILWSYIPDSPTNVAVLNPEPTSAYQLLEDAPDRPEREVSARGATLAERYGTPWPVSGDHLTRAYGSLSPTINIWERVCIPALGW